MKNESNLVQPITGHVPTDSDPILLREHEYITQMMIQNDERNSEGVRAYLAIVGAIATAITIISQFSGSVELIVFLVMANSVFLFVAGVLLLSRLVTSGILRSEYHFRINRITSYFIEKDPSIERVLPYRTFLNVSDGDYLRPLLQSLPRILPIRVLLLWNSILVSTAVATALWFGLNYIGASPLWLLLPALLAGLFTHQSLGSSIENRILAYM